MIPKKLHHYSFLGVLILLIIQGCAPVSQQSTTPYREKPSPHTAVGQQSRQADSGNKTKPAVSLPKNPIVADLGNQADRFIREGRLDTAAQTLERGLRIAPKEPTLWSQLASVKLLQKLYQQAQSLAAKSNSLAGGNTSLIRKNKSIIRKARALNSR